MNDKRRIEIFGANHTARGVRSDVRPNRPPCGVGSLGHAPAAGGIIKEMRRTLTVMLGLVFLFGGAGTSRAEVKRVQMRIGGYLCGN